jgi:hypothetical protein
MRLTFLVCGAALALAGCGGGDQSAENAGASSELSAENFVVNDITAIDAVTADAANMAADVNYMEALENLSGNEGGERSARRPAATTRPRSAPPSREPEEPATNTSTGPAETSSNSTE